jgi:hypothetical protein
MKKITEPQELIGLKVTIIGLELEGKIVNYDEDDSEYLIEYKVNDELYTEWFDYDDFELLN